MFDQTKMPKRNVQDNNRYGRPGSYLMTCDICGTICDARYVKRQKYGLWACDKSINGCYHYEDVFDNPIKFNITVPVPVARPDWYVPTPVVNDPNL